jgi:hypothetical protein
VGRKERLLNSVLFPKLINYIPTSPKTTLYNCLAWALGDSQRWWWPTQRRGVYWPAGMRCDNSIEAFDEFFVGGGASIVTEQSFESGFIKVALFAMGAVPKHVSRQLANGMWTSKMGSSLDISHSLLDVEGPEYGDLVRIYKISVSPQGRA